MENPERDKWGRRPDLTEMGVEYGFLDEDGSDPDVEESPAPRGYNYSEVGRLPAKYRQNDAEQHKKHWPKV